MKAKAKYGQALRLASTLQLTREQWLAASSLLGTDAVLLDYRSPPEVEAVIAAIMDDAGPVVEAPIVPTSAPKVLVSRKRKG
jgi:hypothetical protein